MANLKKRNLGYTFMDSNLNKISAFIFEVYMIGYFNYKRNIYIYIVKIRA